MKKLLALIVTAAFAFSAQAASVPSSVQTMSASSDDGMPAATVAKKAKKKKAKASA